MLLCCNAEGMSAATAAAPKSSGAVTVTVDSFEPAPARPADLIASSAHRSMILDAPIEAVWSHARCFTSAWTPLAAGVKIYPADPADGTNVCVGKCRVVESKSACSESDSPSVSARQHLMIDRRVWWCAVVLSCGVVL